MTLIRRIPGNHDRVDNKGRYQRWLADVSGFDKAETEVVKRVLRIVAQGQPVRVWVASAWQYGTGPIQRATAPGDGVASDYRPLPMPAVAAAVRSEGRGARSEGRFRWRSNQHFLFILSATATAHLRNFSPCCKPTPLPI